MLTADKSAQSVGQSFDSSNSRSSQVNGVQLMGMEVVELTESPDVPGQGPTSEQVATTSIQIPMWHSAGL